MHSSTVHIFNYLQKMRYFVHTGILVDIENLGKNTKCLAVREHNSLEEMRSGVWLKKECREFSRNNFTNIYDIFWEQKADIVPSINSSSTPYFLSDIMGKDPNTIAAINGAFFFLADVADRQPLDLPYNLCISDGEIIGLPSSDQPIAYIQNGILNAQETKATGTVKIGKRLITWVGAQSKLDLTNRQATLYNSRCSEVQKVRDPKTNIQIGILDSENITTPKKEDVVDIIVGKDKNKKFIINHLNGGGGTHFFDGSFILQVKKSKAVYAIGDHITPLTLDGLQLATIRSAITVGNAVCDPFFLEDVRYDRRDARSIIGQDVKGLIHLIVFDGSKYVPGFRGVSAKDISRYFSPEKFKWAYFLDGGGSSRLITRHKGDLRFYANEFAFRKYRNETIIWDWQKARKLVSSISIAYA